MGLTVAQVIERARNEIFEAGAADRPVWDVQEGAINSSVLSLTLEGRQDHLPDDGTIEWDDDSMEIGDVKDVDDVTVTLQTRGYLETTAASHSDGVRVWFDHPYPKQVLFNALSAVIGQLKGFGLYAKTNSAGSLTLSTVTPVSLPSGTRGIVGNVIYAYDGINYIPLQKGRHWDVIFAFTPPKVQFYPTVPYMGRTLYFDYKKDFTAPTALSDDLDTLLIPSSLQSHMAKGIAGYVLQGRDVPQLEGEYIKTEAQPQQPGTRASVGRILWESFVNAVHNERNSLLETYPTTITT